MHTVRPTFIELLSGFLADNLPSQILESRFTDCGGDSIIASALVAQCFRRYGVKVPVSLILRAAQLQDILDYIDARISEQPALEGVLPSPSIATGPFVQNAAQQRIYFAHAVNPVTTAYNIPIILRLYSAVSATRFEQAVADCATQFPMLFSRFYQEQGTQWFESGPTRAIQVQVFSSVGDAASRFVQPFDLEAGLLLRAGIVPFDGVATHLLLDFSHIAADGLSVGMFVKAFKAHLASCVHSATQLKPLQWPDSKPIALLEQKAQAFWQNSLQNVVARSIWPIDRPQKDAAAPLAYAVEYVLLDPKLAFELRAMAERHGTTPFCVMLLAYALLQISFTQQWQSHAGVVVSGRTEPDLADVFGMFVNSLILPFALHSQCSVGAAIQILSDQFLGALDHQSYPFQSQLHHVKNRNDSMRPTLDALLVYQNIEYQKIDIAGGKFRSFCEAKKMAQLPQVIHVFDLVEQGYEIQWEYCPLHFDSSTIAVFSSNFNRLLRQLVKARDDSALAMLFESSNPEVHANLITAADFDF